MILRDPDIDALWDIMLGESKWLCEAVPSIHLHMLCTLSLPATCSAAPSPRQSTKETSGQCAPALCLHHSTFAIDLGAAHLPLARPMTTLPMHYAHPLRLFSTELASVHGPGAVQNRAICGLFTLPFNQLRIAGGLVQQP